MARSRQRQTSRRTNGRGQGRTRPLDNEGLIPILARAVREIESAVERGQAVSVRSRFQAVALLAREERTRVRTDTALTEAKRDGELKRLDGIATILAQTAAREPSLFSLLAEDAKISDQASDMRRAMLERAGVEVEEDEPDEPAELPAVDRTPGRPAVRARPPAGQPVPGPRLHRRARRTAARPAGWPAGSCSARCSARSRRSATAPRRRCRCPRPRDVMLPGALQLMKHQAEVVAAAADGHRTFLLADEPGLGKTAQALLAAEAADAFPLLAVVPNVVKTNWAREASIWVPHRMPTVIHGDGQDINGFADIVVVNYEVLDRHVGWLGDFGFRAMVVDEAHFIKNKTSQRSQNVLQLVRADPRPHRPAAALRPDRHAADQRHRGLPGDLAVPRLDRRQEAARRADGRARGDRPDPGRPGLLPGRPHQRGRPWASSAAARSTSPRTSRPAGSPTSPSSSTTRSAARSARPRPSSPGVCVARYESALATRRTEADLDDDGIDHELVRRVATWEREDSSDESSGENVFGMMRRIGQAKAGLAADYAAQLARSVGKVVFFAKHIDVMDAAQETFAQARPDATPRSAATRPARPASAASRRSSRTPTSP